MNKVIPPPPFEARFLLPHFWPIWFGVGILYTLTWLPFPLLKLLGRATGKVIAFAAPKRAYVAKRNIELTYPELTPEQQAQLLKDNIALAGMGLYETAMGWWWPAWRVRKHIEIEGYEHVEHALAQGKSVFAMALHNMNLEFGCRGLGYTHPSIAFYRKHNNPLIDYLQYRGRAQANKYLIHKRNAKGLLQALDGQELCLYLPDQDYGRTQSIFVPFGGVPETATTTATLMFIKRSDSVPLLVTSQHSKRGYKIKFYPPMPELRELDDVAALTLLNQKIADIIAEQPESYLWMHKRFKTRPNKTDPSLY